MNKKSIFDQFTKKYYLNNELTGILGCSPQGGMRRSYSTKTLTIIADHTKGLYDDKWEGDILLYTGMGRIGDQSLDFQQNRTLADSLNIDIDVGLFEVFTSKQYIYRGIVELVADPYIDFQPDDNGNIRKVWIFPLKVLENDLNLPSTDDMDNVWKKKERKVKKLSDEELEKRLSHAWEEKIPENRKGEKKRKVVTTIHHRNPLIAEYTKRRAGGRCELCEIRAPFNSPNGEPYLENHHILWLSRGGLDVIDNCVALCPNCHKKMHIVDSKRDINKLNGKAIKRLTNKEV